MTRKKGKEKQRKKQASGNVQETGLQNNKMNSDAEDPQNGTRKQKSSAWTYTDYIRLPAWILDWLISGMFWLQLSLYRKAAGRLPLFLKEETEKSGQEITQHTTTIKNLEKTVDQFKAENKELTDLQTISAERIKELEEDLQKQRERLEIDLKQLREQLEEEHSKAKDKDHEITIKSESLNTANKELNESKMKLHDVSGELSETVKLSEIKRKQAEDKINKMNDDIMHLKTEVKSWKNENKSLEDKIIFQNQTQKETEQRAMEKIQSLEKESNNLQYENNELYNRNALLTEQTRELEAEKQDALKRLSEQVSVRLRDNNPNIVDLSDQCRPTKLAEMFSELYDNEWTNAFSVLEDSFTEEHSIVILLDTVMLAYTFCANKLSGPWQQLVEWLLDPTTPGAQQTTKWLKDSRKANVHKRLPEMKELFSEKLLNMCGDESLKTLLSEKDISEYFIKCIELCLLMTATDPPIVLVCPGWKAPDVPQTGDSIKQDQARLEKGKENCSQISTKHVEEAFDINEKEQKSTVDDEETTGDQEFQSNETTINENPITERRKDSGSPGSMEKDEDYHQHEQGGLQEKNSEKEYKADEHEEDNQVDYQEQKIDAEDEGTDRMSPATRVGDNEQNQQLSKTHLKNEEESLNWDKRVVGDSVSELTPPQSEYYMSSLRNPEIEDNSGLNNDQVKEFDRESMSQTGHHEVVKPNTGNLFESEDPVAKIVDIYQDQGISKVNSEEQQQKQQDECKDNQDEDANGNGGNEVSVTDEVQTQQEKTLQESDKEEHSVINANLTDADGQMDSYVMITHDQTTEEGDQRTEKQQQSNDNEKDVNVRYDNNFDEEVNDQHHQPQDDHEKQENSDDSFVNNESQEPKVKESQNSDIFQHIDFGEKRNGIENYESITYEKRDTECDSKQELDGPTDSIDSTGEEAQNITHDEEDRELNTTPDLATDKTCRDVGVDHNQQENGTSVSEDDGTKQEITERQVFDKNTFREYTKRGKYIDYIVWPAMSLYENGELLSKGVAQGSKEQFKKPETEDWTWVKP